jgi:hypothetical protein
MASEKHTAGRAANKDARLKRSRGRPPGPARMDADVDLVGFVKDRVRGVTVAQACAKFHNLRGAKVGTVEQLKKRYDRAAGAYPGKWHTEVVRMKSLGGWPITSRVFGDGLLPGGRLLTGKSWPARKPSKY